MKTYLEYDLVEGLRSGNYIQATNKLKDFGKFCCLGVACDLSRLGVWRGSTYETSERNATILLPEVVEALGWYDKKGTLIFTDKNGREMNLAELNDEGFTFEQIADIIDAELVVRKVEAPND